MIQAVYLDTFMATYVKYSCSVMCFVDLHADRAYVYQQTLSWDYIPTAGNRNKTADQFVTSNRWKCILEDVSIISSTNFCTRNI
jgi:hypothetical protein